MIINKLGWIPDIPDIRDIPIQEHPLNKLDPVTAIPQSVNLMQYCSPVEDQGDLGSCTAHAGTGLYEFFINKNFKTIQHLSRRFLYKVTRRYAGLKGDSGAYLRSTMGAMTLFGIPPEKYWPYDIKNFDVEPDAFCYAFAQNYQSLKYYRVDTNGLTPAQILEAIKVTLFQGNAIMFGFTVYKSIYNAKDGLVPFPTKGDTVAGGHAVLCVGYDDRNQCLIFKNSWGSTWGKFGYGYLPYKYVTEGLAQDWWTMSSAEWTDIKGFDE